MEVLQCDGCDFRARSYEDLKSHIQDVHTAFLQPTDVTEEGTNTAKSVGMHSTNQPEDVFSPVKDEYVPTEETHGPSTNQIAAGSYYGHSTGFFSPSNAGNSKPTSKFFQCKFCVRYFRSKILLMEHTRKVHGHGGGNLAGSSTSGSSNYNIMMHDGFGKVFSCQFCTYKSPRRARIIKHQKMYHKSSLKETSTPKVSQSTPLPIPIQETCKELPAEVVERSILESMVKPLTKSRGNFCCEWCSYQTPRRERWCDHMMKKHRGMVKILSSLRQDGLNIPDLHNKSSHGSSPSASFMPLNITAHDLPNANISGYGAPVNNLPPRGSTSKYPSMPYIPIKPKPSSDAGIINFSPYGVSEKSNVMTDMDSNSLLNESSSDEDYIDIDSENGLSLMDHHGIPGEPLLGSENNKLLETKGIPFRRFMNRFQCPFCPFLTMHRRSISRHIENIHLSGKTAVYKCDECPFSCKSPLKLGAHKQCHTGTSADWDTIGTLNESLSPSLNEPYENSNINGKKPGVMTESVQQNPYKCTMCNYSTTTLKGLRVHQQHKHSFCDNMPKHNSNISRQTQDSDPDLNALGTVKKSQTSILGLSSKNNFVAKVSRKNSNDFPLDLSPVKKRTRIDEIASNLQSKINQSKQQDDSIINVEDDDEDEENEVEIEVEIDKEEDQSEQMTEAGDSYVIQQMWNRDANVSPKNMNLKNIQHNYSASNGAEIELTLSDDEEDYYFQSVGLKEHDTSASVSCNQSIMYGDNDQNSENAEFPEESGRLYYCKHCDFSNKSARSVSTHYQRMHPYIKFSFRYILDPSDHSAVYRCLECYIDYNNFEDLQQHYAEHHPESINVLNMEQSNLIYRCRFCSYTSPNVRSLMPHYQRMHPTVKINNAMIFSSYVVERPEELTSESQTLREILNSAPKNMVTSTPSGHGTNQSTSCNKNASKPFASESESPKTTTSINSLVVYDCDVCAFASPNMHSVLVHYQKKHPDEKASYFRIQKTMRVVSVEGSAAISQLSFDGVSSLPPKSPTVSSNMTSTEFNAELYFCKHCSYSNRSVVGVLVHYQKRHPEIKVTAKYIRQAPPTAAAMRNADSPQIAPVKSVPTHSTKKGSTQHHENEMFFCQQCDYGNQTVKGVLIHYQKKHKDFKVNADAVRQHTAAIRSLCDQGQKKPSFNMQSSPSSNEHEKEKLRSLRCRQCSYSTPYVYALRKHMKKDHPNLKATVTSILKWAFLDGFIEAGYHCEWCIYTHPEPSGLLEHYQRRHPEHYVDYTYMATKLCAGPDTLLSQASESKSYKCRDCTFEAPSIWDITNHYQTFHPWALKSDESVLLDIIKEKDAAEKSISEEATSSQVQSSQKTVLTAEPQLDSGDDSSLSHEKALQLQSGNSVLSSTPYLCTVCNSEYNNLHGLLTHYGKKHPGMKVKAADFAQDIDINPGAVYKCRHCPYINTRIHGVLTHYQKRHPTIKVTAEDFLHDVEPPREISQNEADENSRIYKQGYGAYRCKICPYTHGTLEKLKIHYEKYHDQPQPDILSPSSPKEVSSIEPDTLYDDQPPQTVVTLEPGEVPESNEYAKNHQTSHTVFKCQLCKYFCSTRKGIARHYRIKHNNVRAQPEGKNNLFSCALCSYTNPIRKGLAAHYQKKHDIDAYYTHCLAASRTVSDKPNKVVIPTPPKDDSPELSEELKKAVEKKKCSLCSFQSYSRKGIVSHYMKRHPGVFPKKQYASKLGGYFTTVYSEGNEHQNSTEKTPEIEAPFEPEPQEPELLPFRCIKCFKLSFSTADLLCMHYTDHHSKDIKRDFSILGTSGTRSYTTTFQCKHCNSKLNSVAELTNHLTYHNEEFQKRAKRQERRKQLLNKQKIAENVDSKQEKLQAGTSQEVAFNNSPEKVIVGYRCNFCVEVHPTLRAICNHLRKHIQYGNTPPLPPDLKKDEKEELTDPDKSVDDAKEEPTDEGKPIEEVSGGEEKTPKKGRKFRPGGYPCKQCDRVLMSMQGLRSHERSHLALALFTREDKYSCQFCSFVSAFRHNLDRHIQTHHGHHKPFKCKLCPFKSSYSGRLKIHIAKSHGGEHAYKCSFCTFSTMTISQLKDHSLKVHGKTLTLPRIRTVSQTSPRAKQSSRPGKESGLDESSYSEPPDVQQQLNHYQSAALARNNSNSSPVPLPVVNTSSSEQKQELLLQCEFCDFTSGYIQSIRRHCKDKHGGKKLFKCKDCSFYTCFKSAFTMHVEAGHSATPKEGPKDLRCPLCLYHTKYKHNMIDHIVLHREERVVPIEVCRSKLSKLLQGVVFRCDKCTFTCSSDETLQQHIEKHNELRPYKCQICYFETKQSEELDSHLRDEHKVCRNFELVGIINLDQLEQMKDKTETSSSDEEEIVIKSEEAMFSSPKIPVQEKRFPCEFCGRTFALNVEWERHVSRHGMTVQDNTKGNEENRKPKENLEESQNNLSMIKMEIPEERLVDASQQTSTFKNFTETIETKTE